MTSSRCSTPNPKGAVGGFLGYVITHHNAKDGAFQASGIIGSVVGAVIALVVYRAVSGRRHVL